jgi:cell division protein FtsI/penicillin-binding protein 2
VIDPETGKIKALSNLPTFDPNEYLEAYQLEPLTYDERYIVDDLTYVDIPIYIQSGAEFRQATVDERQDPELNKYVFRNRLGPQVFVDKNIGFPYEPGSIFKSLTLAI